MERQAHRSTRQPCLRVDRAGLRFDAHERPAATRGRPDGVPLGDQLPSTAPDPGTLPSSKAAVISSVSASSLASERLALFATQIAPWATATDPRP
jgi:hypothetical protein